MRIFGAGTLDSFSNGWLLSCFFADLTDHICQFRSAVECGHEANQVLYDRSLVALPAQFVVDAVQTLRSGVPPLPAASFDANRSPVDEPAEHSGHDSDVQAGTCRDFSGARRLPQIDYREIDAALGLGDALQVTAEILGMVVDQRHQLLHQLAQRPVARELRHDDQKARVAAGKYLQRSDLALDHLVAADHIPQAPALAGIQRLKAEGAEQLEERLRRIVQRLEPTGGGGEKHDLRFRLQHRPQLPSEVVIHVPAEVLQVLDHEHDLAPQPVRRVQHRGAGAQIEILASPPSSQVFVRRAQFLSQGRIALGNLRCKMKQGFEPEVARIHDLLALFHEPHRQQPLGERAAGAQLGRDPRQKHRLTASARRDEQRVLARRRIEIVGQNFEYECQLAFPDHELADHFRVGLERPGIELANRPLGWLVHYHPGKAPPLTARPFDAFTCCPMLINNIAVSRNAVNYIAERIAPEPTT